MKISCTACGAKYTIADDKVRGRKVKVRCKSCNNPIVVDTAQQPAADANQFNDATEVKSTAATFGFNEPPAAGNGRGVVWSVNLSDTDQRNLTANEIVEGWRAGWVTDDAYVWKDGMGDWTPILEVPELRALLGPLAQPAAVAIPTAAAPASTATPAATSIPRPASTGPNSEAAAAAAIAAASSGARLAERRQQVAADLFGGAATAGSEDEVIHTSAPAVPGSTPYHEAKPSGARNENSVLFSLDALKAGFAPTTVKQNKPEPVHRGMAYSQPDDPFGMSSGNSGVARLGGGGGVNPLFGADDRALLFAPPPPEPKRPVLAAFTGSPAATTEPVAAGEYALMAPPRRGPNKIVLIGGAVALIAVIVILAFALSGKKSDEVSAAEANKNDTAQKANEKKADEKKAETKDEKTDTAAAAPSASATAATKTATPEANKRYLDAQKKKAEEKEAASSSESEKKTETSAAAETGSSSELAFNKGAAVSALTSAASAASSCKRPGGPTGTGKVTVTFAPNGHITNASVSGGDFEGSSVGGCVASVFRRAHIPAFSGSAVTVSKSFTISP